MKLFLCVVFLAAVAVQANDDNKGPKVTEKVSISMEERGKNYPRKEISG